MARPHRPSACQLAHVGVAIVRREPLTLCCQQCRAEWRGLLAATQRLSRNYWKCQNGCNADLDGVQREGGG
jgi:hypothetical protein